MALESVLMYDEAWGAGLCREPQYLLNFFAGCYIWAGALSGCNRVQSNHINFKAKKK